MTMSNPVSNTPSPFSRFVDMQATNSSLSADYITYQYLK